MIKNIGLAEATVIDKICQALDPPARDENESNISMFNSHHVRTEQVRETHAILIHNFVILPSLAPCKLNTSGSQCYHSITFHRLAKDEAFRMSSIRNVTMVKALFCFHLIGL